MLDLHALFVVPSYLRGPVEWYIGMSGDPFVGVSSRVFGDSSHLAHLGWFKSFLVLELCGLSPPSLSQTHLNPKYYRIFQLPVFFLGIRGLYKGLYIIFLSRGRIPILLCSLDIPVQVLAQSTPSSPSTPPQRQPLLSHAYSRSSKPQKQPLKPSHRNCHASPLINA